MDVCRQTSTGVSLCLFWHTWGSIMYVFLYMYVCMYAYIKSVARHAPVYACIHIQYMLINPWVCMYICSQTLMSWYVCIYVCMYIMNVNMKPAMLECMHAYMYNICRQTHESVCIYVARHSWVCMSIYVCVYVHMNACMSTPMSLCLLPCHCTHIWLVKEQIC